MQLRALLGYAERAASPIGAILWEVEHVGQEWNGIDRGLSWSNGSELDHCLGIYSMTSSIESLERLERAHALVTSLSVEVFPGALQTEQNNGGWGEALENEMDLKDSETYWFKISGGSELRTILP